MPYERFTIRSAADVTTFVLLPVVGVAVSQLAAYARRLKVIAITDAGYLAQIQETTALAQSARSPHDVAEHVREQLDLQRRCGRPERTLTSLPDQAALLPPRIVRLAVPARRHP